MIKGPGHISRAEFEYEIPFADARFMLDHLCLPGVIDKTRYRQEVGGHTWEIDVFHGENDGLVVAEVELEREDEAFERPAVLLQEVSGDARYFNGCAVAEAVQELGLIVKTVAEGGAWGHGPARRLNMSGIQFPKPDPAILARRETIIAGLAALVAPNSLITAEDERRAFETDGLTAYRRIPLAVVLPRTTEESRP